MQHSCLMTINVSCVRQLAGESATPYSKRPIGYHMNTNLHEYFTSIPAVDVQPTQLIMASGAGTNFKNGGALFWLSKSFW